MSLQLIVTNPKNNLWKPICCLNYTKKQITKTVKFYRKAGYEVKAV